MAKFITIDLEIINVDTIMRVVPCMCNDGVYGILVERAKTDGSDMEDLVISFESETERDVYFKNVDVTLAY